MFAGSLIEVGLFLTQGIISVPFDCSNNPGLGCVLHHIVYVRNGIDICGLPSCENDRGKGDDSSLLGNVEAS